MVTKKKATRGGKTDKTVGPTTTSDMNQPAPKADPGAAPAAKTKDGPEEFTVSAAGAEAKAAALASNEDKDERRDEARSLEEKYGAVPNPTVVPQGPSAKRDWMVSNTPSPEETEMAVQQGEIKREIRKIAPR